MINAWLSAHNATLEQRQSNTTTLCAHWGSGDCIKPNPWKRWVVIEGETTLILEIPFWINTCSYSSESFFQLSLSSQDCESLENGPTMSYYNVCYERTSFGLLFTHLVPDVALHIRRSQRLVFNLSFLQMSQSAYVKVSHWQRLPPKPEHTVHLTHAAGTPSMGFLPFGIHPSARIG